MSSVVRPSWTASATPAGLLFISTMSEDSIASSVPDFIEMPTRAQARAGASFTPSPTIATLSPRSSIFITWEAFSSGSTSETTSSMWSSPAMCRAVAALSPVSMTTRRFIRFKLSTAARLSGFRESATMMTPAGHPPLPTYSGDAPCRMNSRRRLSSSFQEIPLSCMNPELPTA